MPGRACVRWARTPSDDGCAAVRALDAGDKTGRETACVLASGSIGAQIGADGGARSVC